jgi:bacterioferritin
MSDKEKLISNMQIIVTHLSQLADGHLIQSRIFRSMGLTKLEKKYAEHAEEERGYVIQMIDRILDLGGDVKLEAKQAGAIFKDPVEWVKFDLQVSIDGLNLLKGMLEDAKDDVTTYDILKEYYKDEEEDMYWGEQQLELIECIGVQNWILQQL